MKKLFYIAIVTAVLTLGYNQIQNVKEQNKLEEERLVNEYVQCLEDNWTQRDYCARQVGSEYHYMDLLIEKYGYTYKQVGYDLYVVKSESVNQDK